MQPGRECTDLRLPPHLLWSGGCTPGRVEGGGGWSQYRQGQSADLRQTESKSNSPGKACTRQLEYFAGNPPLWSTGTGHLSNPSSVTDEFGPANPLDYYQSSARTKIARHWDRAEFPILSITSRAVRMFTRVVDDDLSRWLENTEGKTDNLGGGRSGRGGKRLILLFSIDFHFLHI